VACYCMALFVDKQVFHYAVWRAVMDENQIGNRHYNWMGARRAAECMVTK